MRSEALKWAVLLVVLVVAGGGLYYEYQQNRPCTHPIAYGIGAVDPRFDISNATLISDAEASAAIWNKAAGKTVLVYNENAALKINFIYDEREANARLGAQIAQEQVDADTTRAELDALQAEFTSEQTAYNQTVKTINAGGGASRSE